MIVRTLMIALALAFGAAARAGPLQADASGGMLEFSATQADAKFTGAFKRFHVVLDFDPAQPARGKLDVGVETASIDTQDGERDEILRGSDFFATAKHPKALFHAARFERADGGWRASGELTIRGVTKPVPVTFTLAPAGAATVMKGSASLKRLDFGLGQGEWASTEWVGDRISRTHCRVPGLMWSWYSIARRLIFIRTELSAASNTSRSPPSMSILTKSTAAAPLSPIASSRVMTSTGCPVEPSVLSASR